MKAFICVYRHPEPPKEKDIVKQKAQTDKYLLKFIEEYYKQNNYYDWGDDPSFFMAEQIFGNPNFATWGVCRRNVRKQLNKWDVIVFFCGKQNRYEWNYYFIGFGTVKEILNDRNKIWNEEEYTDYKPFYNLLVDNESKHSEPFGIEHADWSKRTQAPYVLFNPDKGYTNFNLENPLHVAVCDTKSSLIETWFDQPLVQTLKECIFKKYFKTPRGLRIRNIQRAHAHIAQQNITNRELINFRSELLDIL